MPGLTDESPLDRDKRNATPWFAFWMALTVRLGYIILTHRYRFPPYFDHFSFGWEMGRVGRALATGYGYADPFHDHTGPTAWVTPLYPLLVGAVFKLCGVYTALSAFVLLAINSLLSSFTVMTTWEIGWRCFGRRVGLWSAWIWALYPAAMQYATKWVWEMTLTTFLFTCVLVLALRMRNVDGSAEDVPGAATPKRWLLFGLLWGLIALSNPSLLLFLPVSGLWILCGNPQRKKQIGGAVLSGCIFLFCVAPWTYRNWLVFHHFVPLRTNFGEELYLGNGPGETGTGLDRANPALDGDQRQIFREMGEIAYGKARGDEAKVIIRQSPGRFAVLCLKRIYYFWFGATRPKDKNLLAEYGPVLQLRLTSLIGLLGLWLLLKRRNPASVLLAGAFLTLPMTYYLVTVNARFRHPLEPLIAILGVYLFQSAEKSWRIRWFSR
jgi:4-amino-4-deoxy-L-arabinose transferase-like glycosyltransferase